jgi:hypothetical protein
VPDSQRVRAWLYLLALASVNIFICREAFFTESTGHWNSMHGIWIAMARLNGLDWLPPKWQSYWGGGAPFQFAYAPLIPATTAAIARLLHVSLALAFHGLTATVYCFSPVVLYVVSWRLFRTPGYSFAAALAYSLLSPAQLVVPDYAFRASAALEARRMFLMFDWDDLPHMTSLALLPVAVLFLGRAWHSRRLRDYALASAAMAAMMVANMFGVVLVALTVVTVPLAIEQRFRPAMFLRPAMAATAAYLTVCPWLPPSLLLTARRNAALDGEGDTLFHALIALAIVGGIMAIVWWLASRRVKEWPLRWILLFACPAVLIPTLSQYWGPHFLPQPFRYKEELELAVAWLAPFALGPFIERVPSRFRYLWLVPLVVLAGFQVRSHRRWARQFTRQVDVVHSIESRAARWAEANLPSQRVMMSGSIAQWLDYFTNQPHIEGQTYATAMNWMEPVAIYTVYSDTNAGDRGAEISILWLQALGVQAVAVPGPKSSEYWKPFIHPRKFEGVLPVLWNEDDTTIYHIPQVSSSLAHVVRRDQLVQHRPAHGLDVRELGPYVAALEDTALPAATLQWRDANHALVRAHVDAGQVISTQINYHRGWHASANASPPRIYADGLGFMAIDPGAPGDYEILLSFDGGWESKICIAASIGTLLLLLAASIRACC